MNFTTDAVTEKLTNFARSIADENMIKAIEDNVFYVVATFDMRNNIYIGSMDDDLPGFISTEEEAKSENQYIIDDIQEQINLKERDEDDEWDGEVLKARLTEDDKIAFFSLDDTVYESPIGIESIKDTTGH